MRAKIGERRIYDETLGILYPGEHATAIVDVEIDEHGYVVTETVQHWMVEPIPGFWGWWDRMDYRLTHWGYRSGGL